MEWTRKPITEASDWFNQKPLAPLDETLRVPLAMKKILKLLKEEYGIEPKGESYLIHQGYFYARNYQNYFLQLAFQPGTYFLLWRLLRETEKAKNEFEQNINQFQKEIKQLKKKNLTKLSNQELLKHTNKTIKFEINWFFKLGFGLQVIYHHFSEMLLKFLYKLLVKDQYPQNYHELLIGYPSKIKEADLAFWQVVKGKLTLEEYQEKYGYRASDVSLAIPTIGEDKQALQQRINAFQNTDIPDFQKKERKIIRKRKKREEYVENNFRTWIPFGKTIFNKVLKIARDYIPIRETRRFYYSQGTYPVRKTLLELGKRLTLLETPEDIFFLKKNELEKAVKKPNEIKEENMRTKIKRRKKEYQKQTEPPETIKQ